MRHVIAIIGRPGTGKSTFMRELIARLEKVSPFTKLQLAPLLWAHQSRVRLDHHDITILGDYSDPAQIFPGTDRLSMAVAPVALRWIREQSAGDVLFEGDRLGNESTLRLLSLDPSIRLRIFLLTAPEHELTRRYMMRGSAQSYQVLRARATKIARIYANPNFAVRVWPMHSDEQREALIDEVLRILKGQA